MVSKKEDKGLKSWKAIFLAISLAIISSGIVPAFIGFLTKVYEIEKSAEPVSHVNLRTTSLIYNSMVEMESSVGADSVVLLKAHNSGSPIPNKSTIVAEVFADNKTSSVFDRWQSQTLYTHYVTLLEDLLASKRTSVVTEEIEGSSILKNIYLSSEIIKSDIRYLGADEDNIYYLSIGFTEDTDFDPKYETLTRAGTERIKGYMRDMGAFK